MPNSSKKCSKCGDAKSVSLFQKRSSTKSGFHSWCKICCSTHDKYRYRNNIEYRRKKLDSELRWRAKNPDRDRESARKYYLRIKLSNPEHLKNQRRKSHIKRTYGMSMEDEQRMKRDSGGVCSSCMDFTRLVIDHNHSTGKIRGLLCDPCNRAAGCLRDDPERARKLSEYLSRN